MKILPSDPEVPINKHRRKLTVAPRSDVLKNAFEKHPYRFKGKMPQPPEIPEAAWINKPDPKEDKN
jgi:hypothetical protein